MEIEKKKEQIKSAQEESSSEKSAEGIDLITMAKQKIKRKLKFDLKHKMHKKEKDEIDKMNFRFIDGADNLNVKDIQRHEMLNKLNND